MSRAAIFDLDGTLIDSAPAIAAVGNRMLAELDLAPMSLDEARGYIGHGAARFVAQALEARGGGDPADATARFQAIYAAADGAGNTPYPGAEAALRALRAHGFALGLCTNKPMAPTRVVLDRLGWRGLFGAVVAGDTLALRKPDPAPLHHCAALLGVETAAVIYIGDSEVDAATAAAASVSFVLHTPGYRHAPLEAVSHDAAFDDFAALPALVARAGGA